MNIEELKNQLIATDDEILKLFIRHLELTQLIGKEKAKEGKGLYDRKAEEELLERVVANSPQEIQNFSIELFRTIMNTSKEHFAESK
ncbi:MAG: chorismate mutase [Oscillospiraceae bacterium]|nr:chorismate mutase [Oscillospiraceae bacterium]MBP1553946.1 chorismate mutase [Oscillospiraceae bacterium]MBP1570616.1 chorismate mutase [Oscillospiraceae bacterium]MBQ5314326.1 chorismate mutase [Oscillospiraceae bacterium]MBQ5323853.1 chorismate mutase [Oscillospiraceae bacterium]